ncbi:hypothetical protein PHLCEN_2v325 [Hermanssonia centrifuga]|uniref:hydroxyethylthiazole kinase n=1 Tax=Hermanssonia centrifuga TaxID=98765 RepID=A0A2R6S6E4_9APHY|nr:hypothetical protein PHLCEN_2v325 [Hermanssonia centrifuga]
MPVNVARALLPKGTIIGKTCNTPDHVKKAIAEGVDYVGIGPVWGTLTKKVSSPVVGPKGIGEMLETLDGSSVKAVAIDPRSASQKLSKIIHAFYDSSLRTFSEPRAAPYSLDGIKSALGTMLASVKEFSPLVHQITNNVVTNQSANATLALGASPIMATAPEEMADLSKAIGALLINFGTIQNLDGMLAAGLLSTWQATVIKGNAAELGAIANSLEVQARGVDSVGKGFADPAKFVLDLARKQRCIVVLTGVTDWVSDGTVVIRLSNGHPLLGDITGSGCMVGTCVATFCAGVSMAAFAKRSADAEEDGRLVRGDMLLAAVGG